MSAVETRLRDALFAGVSAGEESPDLFARIQLSIEDDRRQRAQRRRAVGIVACILGAVAASTRSNDGSRNRTLTRTTRRFRAR